MGVDDVGLHARTIVASPVVRADNGVKEGPVSDTASLSAPGAPGGDELIA